MEHTVVHVWTAVKDTKLVLYDLLCLNVVSFNIVGPDNFEVFGIILSDLRVLISNLKNDYEPL